MRAFFEISELNIYIQIAVTIISIAANLIGSRGKQRKESLAEIMAIYTIGLSG